MKKFVAIILAVSLALGGALSAFGYSGSFSGIGMKIATESVVYVNPLYEDVVTEEEIAEAAAAVPGKGEYDIFSSSGDFCNTAEKAAEIIRENLKNRNKTFSFTYVFPYSYGVSIEEIAKELFDKALEHTGNPTEGDYLQWQYGGWHCDMGGETKNGTAYITYLYAVNYYTTAEQEKEVDQEVAEVLAELDLEGKNDYEKIHAIYDYICGHTKYDYANLNDDSYKIKYTAYGALINGTSVCQGYANLLYRLALEAGVDARIITGISFASRHAWNIVELKENYYNLDSTWDAGNSNYYYFLKSDSSFVNHERDEEYAAKEFYAAYPMGANDYVYSESEEPDDPEEPKEPDEPEKPEEPEYVDYGDVNGDDKINVLDANMVRKVAAMLITLDEGQKLAADVNGDGKVNVIDANLIRKYVAKLIEVFPAQGKEPEKDEHEHSWVPATCEAPKTCSVCGATEGEPLGHSYEGGYCSVCGELDPDAWLTRDELYDVTLAISDSIDCALEALDNVDNSVVCYNEGKDLMAIAYSSMAQDNVEEAMNYLNTAYVLLGDFDCSYKYEGEWYSLKECIRETYYYFEDAAYPEVDEIDDIWDVEYYIYTGCEWLEIVRTIIVAMIENGYYI